MPETDPALDLLLDTARRAARRGDVPRARAVLRALSLQHPADARVWELLADVAGDDIERREVLARLAALSQPAPRVTEVLPELQEPPPVARRAAAPVDDDALHSTPVTLEPPRHAPPPRRPRWPLYVVTAAAAAAIALLLLLRSLGMLPSLAAQPTASLPAAEVTALTAAPVGVTVEVPAPTAAPADATGVVPAPTAAPAAPTAAPTAVPTEPPAPTGTPAPPPSPTPLAGLSPGQVIQAGTWTITVLRPQDAVLLDGSIGGVVPRGRFALVLVAVGNGGDAPARIPERLITLMDPYGTRYSPAPGASAAYLQTYGRGQFGDVAYEESIPVGGGNVSVPVIFDVPLDAGGLRLLVGDAAQGWAVPGQ